jgi:AbiV family abortive infection protein
MRRAGAQAGQLAQDARLLLDSGSYPTAAALAALSIEESSKSVVLRSVLAAKCTTELKRAWADYRRHGAESILWRFLSADLIKVQDGTQNVLIDLSGAMQRHNDLDSEMLNEIKQAGLYTDCVGDEPHWIEPKTTITRELAENLVNVALSVPKVFGTAPTTKETEIWEKHLASLSKPGLSEAEIAQRVEQWVKEMIECGFLPATMPPGFVIK